MFPRFRWIVETCWDQQIKPVGLGVEKSPVKLNVSSPSNKWIMRGPQMVTKRVCAWANGARDQKFTAVCYATCGYLWLFLIFFVCIHKCLILIYLFAGSCCFTPHDWFISIPLLLVPPNVGKMHQPFNHKEVDGPRWDPIWTAVEESQFGCAHFFMARLTDS